MYFLGIDAGGTKTSFALGDDERTIATTTSGTVKLGNTTADQARSTLVRGIHSACESAGIKPQEISACAVGLSGASIPEICGLVMTELVFLLENSATMVFGDHVIAHRAAFPDGGGVLVISGTGSICFGRTLDGREIRSGGHGSVISDEGSGTWIGRELLRRLLRAQDVGLDLLLLEELVNKYGSGDQSELIRKANAGEITFSDLVPYVLSASSGGDELATDLLKDAGSELAALATDVAAHLFESDERVRFALSGSITQSPPVKEEFLNGIMQFRRDAQFVESSLSPVEGALIVARELPERPEEDGQQHEWQAN
jgi:glucosamine kinase